MAEEVKPKATKYKAKKIYCDGIKFDSHIEMLFYEKCKDDKAKELIHNFELQPQYIIQPKYTNIFGKNIQAIILKADFLIYEIDGTETVIDTKGMATPESKMKRKMFGYVYPKEKLIWLSWYSGKWVNYDDLIKGRRERKKEKARLLSLQENL